MEFFKADIYSKAMFIQLSAVFVLLKLYPNNRAIIKFHNGILITISYHNINYL